MLGGCFKWEITLAMDTTQTNIAILKKPLRIKYSRLIQRLIDMLATTLCDIYIYISYKVAYVQGASCMRCEV